LEIKVVKLSGDYLELEITGEDHTLGNLIAGSLRKVQGVKYASYYQPHPLIDAISIKLMTDGTIKPLDALLKAIEIAKGTSERFAEEIQKI